ncbi:hypothetical protein MAPG_09318, partial [Magnaporthiopsis poae ATCC 64411]|uniref:Uncharacterized protein n=1 Tax=Magnaporthiopsis poae (strain ATCC 64411 / 73-15) TaxID=644358 RepID=A0A0C4E9M2_MAGP6
FPSTCCPVAPFPFWMPTLPIPYGNDGIQLDTRLNWLCIDGSYRGNNRNSAESFLPVAVHCGNDDMAVVPSHPLQRSLDQQDHQRHAQASRRDQNSYRYYINANLIRSLLNHGSNVQRRRSSFFEVGPTLRRVMTPRSLRHRNPASPRPSPTGMTLIVWQVLGCWRPSSEKKGKKKKHSDLMHPPDRGCMDSQQMAAKHETVVATKGR